jgi:hypothetical protein
MFNQRNSSLVKRCERRIEFLCFGPGSEGHNSQAQLFRSAPQLACVLEHDWTFPRNALAAMDRVFRFRE